MSNYSGKQLIDYLMNEFLSINDSVVADINNAFVVFKNRYFFNNDIRVVKGLVLKLKMILYEKLDTYKELVDKINMEKDKNVLNKLIETDIYFIENVLLGTNLATENDEIKELMKHYFVSLKYIDKNFEERKKIIDKLNSIQILNNNVNYKMDENKQEIYWDKITEKNYELLRRGV